MTIDQLISWLFVVTPVAAQRVEKAQREAARNALAWPDVLAAMTDEQRQYVQDAD